METPPNQSIDEMKNAIHRIAEETVHREKSAPINAEMFYSAMNDNVDSPVDVATILQQPELSDEEKKALKTWLDRWGAEKDFRAAHYKALGIPTKEG